MALDGQSMPAQRKGIFVWNRNMRYSPGHNPPRYVPEQMPTLPQGIFGDGGPGKAGFRTQGTLPWIAGSMTIGSNRIFVMDYYAFNASSPNIWFKLRHNHSGTSAIPGGTIEDWTLQSRGRISDRESTKGLIRIRGPGTLFLYGFGPTGSNASGHFALGSRTIDRFSGHVRGWIE